MPNNSGVSTTATFFTPIHPGREDELQARLLRIPIGAGGPFMALGTTHFVRWVIIDRLEYEATDQKPDGLKSHYLLFNATFDGPLDAFIDAMLNHFPSLMDEVWGNCISYPGSARREAVHQYLRHNELEATFFLSAYNQATLPTVLNALERRMRFTDFAIAAQGLSAEQLHSRFRDEFRS